MNKFLCKETKKRNKFKRVMCGMCNYASRCINLHEYQQGHSDELREGVSHDESKASIEVETER